MKSRSRGLDVLHERIAPYSIVKIIEDLKKSKPESEIRILEIGTGYGRVLMELKRQFPKLQMYGMNYKESEHFKERSDYAKTAMKFGIFTSEELKSLELPQILFIDADHGNRLPFEDGSIDLVFSQSTLQHIKHKMELILELNRILRVGSMGIHTSWRNLAFYHQGREVSEEQWITIMNQKEIIKFEIFNIGKVIAHKKINSEKFPYKFSVIPDLTDKMQVVLEVTKPEDLAEKGIVYKMEL